MLHQVAPPRLPPPCAFPPTAACNLQAAAVQAGEPAKEPARVALITTLGCPHCKQAKAALQVRRVADSRWECSLLQHLKCGSSSS